MRYEVLEQFFGQPIEITLVSRGTYSGILRQSEYDDGSEEIVELEPGTDHGKKRFSAWVLETDAIVGVRLIKPHTDDDDGDEDDCCEKSS
jgi:hypothetical protein